MGDTVVFGILWVVLSIVGELAANVVKKNPLYYIASKQGLMAQSAFDFLLTFLLPIFIFVALFLVYTLVRFRAKRGEVPKSDKPYATRNKAFIGVWVGASILVNLLFFLHPTAADLEQMYRSWSPSHNKGDLVVNVTARQWQWIFSYPQYGLTETVNSSGHDELVLPVGQKVKFLLRSYDPFHTYDNSIAVIHSFWVPAFGLKEDIIPGETRTEYVTPTKITSYAVNPMVRVQCAEVCGPGHPWMEAPVKVVSPAAFKQWIAKQKKLQNG